MSRIADPALEAQLERWEFYRRPLNADPVDPLTEAELRTVEDAIDRPLPHDFRWFCLTHGSGYSHCQLTIELEDNTYNQFDRIGAAHELRFGSYWLTDDDGRPLVLVPCASDLMGNQFFLRFDESNDGSVWFWDRLSGQTPEHSMYRAADSFTKLLESSNQVFWYTERLMLRAFEHGDSEALFAIEGSTESIRPMPGAPLTSQTEAAALIDNRRLTQKERHYSMWAVVLRSSGEVVGSCGFRSGDRNTPFELDYVLDHKYWGKGFELEAAGAAIESVVFSKPGPIDVFVTTHSDNASAIAAAEQLGMSPIESTPDERGQLLKFGMNAPAYDPYDDERHWPLGHY